MALRTIAQSWLSNWSPWRLRRQVAENLASAEKRIAELYAAVDRHAADASRWRRELCVVDERLVSMTKDRDSLRTGGVKPLFDATLIDAMLDEDAS